MKPRSAVAALLAVTETLLAARAKAARAKQNSSEPGAGRHEGAEDRG